MTDRPHWSYSALTQFLRCPLQYYFQRIVKLIPEFTPSGLALGSSIHQALAGYHHCLKENFPITPEEIRAMFLEAWHKRSKQEQIKMQASQTENDILAQGINLLDAYLQEPPPENILGIEEEMIAPLITSQGEILEKPLVTIVDLITQPGT